ncbi:hypothetical protein B9T31_12340 [Acinetobacter sp. ANC 4558]|uniref:hypothetical protein n=1 Tax=Acinetobacter sp. ANC 4558 TaxID=1977876 RepID=UPI000A34014D|nr:hypothetical protein [Acinetobacter sp. ANC 4558]OTG85262.1 hypothetical protein B9T31_12340 [Acinetobacter sp. ANC 4558]
MLLKKILKTSFLIILVNSVLACSHNNDKAQNNSQVRYEQKKDISAEDRRLIEEYNHIIEDLVNGDENKYQQELKLFLPKASQIKDSIERNNILMNIYMQTKQYKNAYKLNDVQIQEDPTANRLAFRCQILELLNKEQSVIKQCYEVSAKAIKVELEQIQKNDPMYNYAEFTYYLEMYRAGHTEYKEKMRQALSSIKDESMKMNANIWYEDAVSRVSN